MDYEKKYKEAIKEAAASYKDEDRHLKATLERIFPELKEPEDERIRKEIISALKNANYKGVYDKHLAWLEKQKEQSIISHKFNVGDWIVSKWGGIYQIKEVMSESYNLLCTNNAEEINSITQVDNNSRLLCISDIKKLEKQSDKPFDYENANIQQNDFAPKSQRMMSAKAKEALYGKPAWSEEDEKTLQGIWDEILANKHDAKEYEWKTYDKFLNWLKSLKDRYTWKPSDEQVRAIDVVRGIPNRYSNDTLKALDSLYNDLKKLRKG